MKKENKQPSEKVLVSLNNVEAYKKIREILPDYKLTYSEFCDEMNEHFIDAIENNDGHLDLQMQKPENAIKKTMEDPKT